jgi:hypothetical protein
MDEGAKVPDNDALRKPEDTVTAGKGTGCHRGRRSRKRIWLALALVAAAVAAAAWLLWERGPGGPPQIVTLKDGQKIQFVGTTYGIMHEMGSTLARLADRLPLKAYKFVVRHFQKSLGPLFTEAGVEPTLVVWFREVGTNAAVAGDSTLPSTYCTLADEHGLESCYEKLYDPMTDGAGITSTFRVIPRRSAVLELRVYGETTATNEQGRFYEEIGRIHFPNPLYGRFPEWKPEPVPAAKMAGDLEVRLEDFMTDTPVRGTSMTLTHVTTYTYSGPARQGNDVRSVFDVKFHSPRGDKEGWMTQSAELSDATGNVLRCGESADRIYIDGTPMPNEAAWRLKLEVKRSFGFSPEELVVFKNVPVPSVGTRATNAVTNLVGGVELVLTVFKRNPDINDGRPDWENGMSSIHYKIHAPPHGVAVDLVRIRTETGGNVEKFVPKTPSFVGASWAEGADVWDDSDHFVYMKSIPANAKTLDITWAVQKTRPVEFLVKPPSLE